MAAKTLPAEEYRLIAKTAREAEKRAKSERTAKVFRDRAAWATRMAKKVSGE